ncbi:serine/threonine protein kinase, partial [Streptomyces sp. SID2955]|nr:serine/threonine protein kinase [Streptomyces sp. SID2955]
AGTAGRPALDTGADVRAARAGAIAAYRAGARAAARVHEAQQGDRPALPGARPAAEEDTGAGRTDGTRQQPYAGDQPPYSAEPGGGGPPGRTADPYGERGAPWHGAAPR